MQLKDGFLERWAKYFPGADLPVVFYYTDDPGEVRAAGEPKGWRCFIGALAKTRSGEPLAFDNAAVTCRGGKRYLGFTSELFPKFDYFLSCGLDGEVEGERYKKTPELVRQLMYGFEDLPAPARYIVFKRWDGLEEPDSPEGVVFFTYGDILSGLFTLANFDRADSEGVFAPFSAGCGSIVRFVRLEARKENPRAVLGMFDVSARPTVEGEQLSFSVPFEMFRRMVGNMDESFLITESWDKVRKRIAGATANGRKR